MIHRIGLIGGLGLLMGVLPWHAAAARFIDVKHMTILASPDIVIPEMEALAHFNKAVARFTGAPLTIRSGSALDDTPALLVGNRGTLAPLFSLHGWAIDSDDADVLRQSYVVATLPGTPSRIVAAGFGDGSTPRDFLGLGYALGELLRRLDVVDGRWGFVIPDEGLLGTPETPNRTLYLMNSNNSAPGLSLEYWNDEELLDYVGFLVDARYSRVQLWQWASLYLYPGNNDVQRAENQRVHRTMRRFFEFARRRGLEVYHGLTPVHVPPSLLPDDPKYTGTGYYGKSGACWSQPEGRELARRMAQAEMEYFGPVDGYVVWFYDPGGCFCAACKPNQARNISEQLMLVADLAKGISPGAKFQAVLWPTWCWHQYQDQGIPFTQDEAEAMVSSFLDKALAQFGPRNLTILDSCEADNTNIYNGLVSPAKFQRSAFMYSVLGMASEHGYPFAPFKFGYLNEKMGLARDRGCEDGNLFIQYAATNTPSVFTFADTLYGPAATTEERIGAYVRRVAKGTAFAPAMKLFQALERAGAIGKYEARDKALTEAEAVWPDVADSDLYFGDKDWLKGYLKAQRHYLELARAADDAAFKTRYDLFKADLAAIPMYRSYMEKSMTPQLCVNLHLKAYWRGPGEDYRMVGLPPDEGH